MNKIQQLWSRIASLLQVRKADDRLRRGPGLEPSAGVTSPRLGFMAGQIQVPDDFDSMGAAEIEKLFEGDT